tara:strand:- start:104 stop:316 length:213 start_codon:yes stop_codon:yes gene_type:complete
MDKKAKDNLSSFEKDLEKMETLLQEIESGDLALEDNIEKFKLGMELSKKCKKALEEAQQKIKKIIGGKQE